MPLEVSCTNEEKVHIAVHPITSHGKAVAIDGAITVEIQSGEGTSVLDSDGLGFFAISGDNPGDTAYLVSADADLGEGVETISDVVILKVAGVKASNLGITADTPVEK